jgi:hypothetical protein
MDAFKLDGSSQYLCLAPSITFISRPHDVLDHILAPYTRELAAFVWAINRKVMQNRRA